MTVSCTISGLTTMQIGGVKSAELWLVTQGYVRRRTKLKNLSAKKIAEIVTDLAREKYGYYLYSDNRGWDD